VSSQRHIIKRQVLDVQIEADIPVFELQNRLSTLYRSKIVPLIDDACSQLSQPGQVYRIDTLEIDLGRLTLQTLEADFVAQVAEQLPPQLAAKLLPIATELEQAAALGSGDDLQRSTAPSAADPHPSVETPALNRVPFPGNPPGFPTNSGNGPSIGNDSPDSRNRPSTGNDSTVSEPAVSLGTMATQLEQVSYFLRTGRLPWWAKSLSHQELEAVYEQLLATAPAALATLLRTHLKAIQPLTRLIYQFSDHLLSQTAALFNPEPATALAACMQDLQGLVVQVDGWQNIPRRHLRLVIWQGVFSSLTSTSNSHLRLARVIESSLHHLAMHLQTDRATVTQRLCQTMQDCQAAGLDFGSSLSQVLTDIPTTPHRQSRTPFDTSRVESETLSSRLADLLSLNVEYPLSSSLRLQINTLLRQLMVPSTSETSESSQAIQSFPALLAQVEALVEALTQANLPAAYRSTIQAIAAMSSSLQSTAAPSYASTKTFSESEEIYIHNAGLVLLWPFLSRFFAELGLVQAGQFIDTQAATRGVLLLQYLVEPAFAIPEHLLPLNKILCGLDLAIPIDANLDISEPEQSECHDLLLATIARWSALKNTTVDGLRQAFLQRPGILIPEHGQWQLKVEHATFDILLDRLPWSIRVIKLPWMEDLLYVEW
jgi:hypothetical protein